MMSSKPELHIGTPEEASHAAAIELVALLNRRLASAPRAVLQLSSGGTPALLYRYLTSQFRHSVDWSRVYLVQMDEYCGLPLHSPHSQFHGLRQAIADLLPFAEVLAFEPRYQAAPEKYDLRLAALGGVDVAVHGLGENGHLAFNEPGSPFDSGARKVELADSTRAANARFFSAVEAVPRFGVTVGLKTVAETTSIIVMAFGARKAQAVAAALYDDMSPQVPATLLQTLTEVYWYMDGAAAADIRLRETSHTAEQACWPAPGAPPTPPDAI